MSEIEAPGIPFWSIDQIQSEISNGFGLGLFESQNLLAFIIYKRLSSEVVEISFLASRPDQHRKGLMSQLFVHFLKTNAQAEVWLEVHEKNLVAIHFYERFKFRQVGRRAAYYADQGSALLYSLPAQART